MDGYRVNPGTRLRLASIDPDETGGYKKNEDGKAKAKAATAELIARLDQ